ncbi:MAG TPA: hypothetical protein VK961_03130 [Chthoniobacter sp.]|nr:hypothetical protein [Chthoniobacter sp.]
MRGLVLGCYLLFCAALVRAEDSPGALRWFADWLAPEGANFQVVIEFSDLKLEPKESREQHLLPSPRIASPAAEWTGSKGRGARSEMCCVVWPMGLNDLTLGAVRLKLTNPADIPMHTTLSVRIVPRGELHALSFEKHSFLSEGRLILISDTPSRGAILAESPFAPRPLSPQDSAHVESAKGECRGEMLFDLTMAPGQTQALGFIVPLRLPKGAEPALDFYRELTVDQLFTEAQKQSGAGDRSKP